VAGGSARHGSGARIRSGAAYNPSTNTSCRLPLMPRRPVGGPALWDGKEVLFLSTSSARGMAYNPVKNRWRLLPAMPLPRSGFAAVWTGHHVLIGGGLSGRFLTWAPPPHGEAYNPATNRWSALPASPLHGRASPVAVWTGQVRRPSRAGQMLRGSGGGRGRRWRVHSGRGGGSARTRGRQPGSVRTGDVSGRAGTGRCPGHL
jgi:hypothetical protein